MWDCFTAPGGGWSLAVVAAAAHPPAEGHAGGPTPGGQRAHSEDASEGPLQHCEAADPDTQCWGPPTTTGWASQRCLNVSYTKKSSQIRVGGVRSRWPTVTVPFLFCF